VKLALAGLPMSAADKYPASLSGHDQACGAGPRLALDPDILFLDEPTAGLDPIGAAAFDQLILTLRDALGLSVFLVTHDLDTLYTITDRAVLSQKKVLVAGPLAEVEQTDDAWIHEYFHGPRGAPNRLPPVPGRSAEQWKPEPIMFLSAWSPSCGGRRHAVRPVAGQVQRRRRLQGLRSGVQRSGLGLSRGSPVQYNGIKVGDVDQPAPGPKDPRRVLARYASER
jgi:energy-coupling factor transporter ATP-binding protein EcfA2